EGYTNWREDYMPEAEEEETTKDESPLKTSAKKTKAKRKPKPKPKQEAAPEGDTAKRDTDGVELIGEAGKSRILAMASTNTGKLRTILKKYGADSLNELAGNFEMAVISDLQKKG
ncbi:MAG: hypothetical protein V3W32_04110, partial [Gemmatimonadota bacterium]